MGVIKFPNTTDQLDQEIENHTSDFANPHGVTAEQINLYGLTGWGVTGGNLRQAVDLNDASMASGLWFVNGDVTLNAPHWGWCVVEIVGDSIRQFFHDRRSVSGQWYAAMWTRIHTSEGWSSWTRTDTPVGQIITYPSLYSLPQGYLKCNGAAISRTTYSNLYVLLGTRYGAGDGSTTFNLPDLRGEFVRGWDDGRGVDSGRVFGSWQGDAFKSHAHGYKVYGYTISNGSYAMSVSSGGGHVATPSTLSVGGAETRPRNVALMYCIKY